MPATKPSVPTLVDLPSLRPDQRLLRECVTPSELEDQRALLHGCKPILLLPGSRPATYSLGGRE